jgi:hypothetical protein
LADKLVKRFRADSVGKRLGRHRCTTETQLT